MVAILFLVRKSFTLLAFLLLAGCGKTGSYCLSGYSANAYPGVGYLQSADAACTGTLIGPHTVLTAGHCAAGEAVNSLQFTLDPAPISNPRASFATATTVRFHPSFNPGSQNDPGVDVALIELGSTNYGGSGLNTFFPFGSDSTLNNSQAALQVGYGDNADGSTGRERFKPVMINGLLDLPTPQGTVHNGLIQVVRGATGQIGCAGDSGSPLLWRTAAGTQIVGVYSTGEDTPGETDLQECVSGTSAGDYVAVDIFRSFVETTRQQYEGATPTACN